MYGPVKEERGRGETWRTRERWTNNGNNKNRVIYKLLTQGLRGTRTGN